MTSSTKEAAPATGTAAVQPLSAEATAILNKNLAGLAANQPVAARHIPRQVEVPSYRHFPTSEAEIKETLKGVQLEAGGVIAVLGLKDGAFVRELAARSTAGTRIIIYEPNLDRFCAYMTAVDSAEVWTNPRVTLVLADPAQVIVACEQAITKTNSFFRVVRQFQHLPAEEQTPYQELMENALLDFGVQQPVRFSTLDVFGKHFVTNILSNLPRIAAARSFSILEGRGRGRPTFVIGSGPSLDTARPLLERWHGKATFVAADSALRALSAWGLRPHLVTTVDPQACTANKTLGLETEGIGLVFHPCASPALIQAWEGPRYTCDIGISAYQYFMKDHWTPKGTGLDWRCHCQTQMADTVATLLGGTATILVGMDLCFPGGRMHTEHGYLTDEENEKAVTGEKIRSVTNHRGHEVATSPLFLSYKHMWEQRLFERPPATPWYNVVDQGIAIKGATNVLLEDVDARLSSDCSSENRGVVLDDELAAVDWSGLQTRIEEFLLECERLDLLAEQVLETVTPLVETPWVADRENRSAVAERLMFECSHPSPVLQMFTVSDTELARTVGGDVSLALDRVEDPIKRLEGQALRAKTFASSLRRAIASYQQQLKPSTTVPHE